MKYYTKEWYNLMQNLDYVMLMKPIEDGTYTDAEIDALYRKKLKARIRGDRAAYNEPPAFIDLEGSSLTISSLRTRSGACSSSPRLWKR